MLLTKKELYMSILFFDINLYEIKVKKTEKLGPFHKTIHIILLDSETAKQGLDSGLTYETKQVVCILSLQHKS